MFEPISEEVMREMDEDYRRERRELRDRVRTAIARLKEVEHELEDVENELDDGGGG